MADGDHGRRLPDSWRARARRAAHLAAVFALLASCTVALGADAGSSGTSDFRCRGAIATLVGTAGADRLRGTSHDDVIVARAGNDVVYGLAGDDRVCDNDGTDHVLLGPGEDEAGGGRGNDHLEGGSGEDWLAGRRGNDTIEGDAGNDRIIGELGNDTLRGEGGNDNLGGGPGTDDCRGGPGRDRVRTCEAGEPRSDRPPEARDDTDSTSEVTPKIVAVLANDSDPDRDPLSVASLDTAGTQGNVTITPEGTGVRYDPNGRFSSLGPGESATDTFRYSLAGGAGFATVIVTVSGVDTDPTAAGDTRTVTEDGGAEMIDALGNDTDPDGGAAKSIQSVTQPANGMVTITGGGSALTYEPEPDYCNAGGLAPTDNFTYQLAPGGSSATVAVTVDCLNDAPVLMTDGTLSYTEGDGAVPVDTGLSALDIDSASLQGAVVQFTANFSSAEDELAFTDQNGITGTYDSGTGILTLTGTSSVANYETALRSVTFENSSNTPSTATRTVSFEAADSSGDTSNVASRDIAVSPANDAPVLTTTGGNTAVAEDALATVDGGLTVTDTDDTNLESATVRISSGFQAGDSLVFANQNGISGAYDAGTGVLTLTGSATKANYQTALRSIQFRTTNDAPATSKTVEFKVNDGSADSNTPTKGIAVTGVNDAPTLNTTGSTLMYGEGSGPVMVDAGVTASDPDSTNLQGATVSITSGFNSADDSLAFTDQLGITGTYNSGTGVLTLTGTTTVANYQAALRTVTYENSSDNPSSTRTVSFQATDASAAPSNIPTRGISFVPSNDAPVVTTSGGSTAYTEGDPATVVDGALTVADPDDTNIESAQVRISGGFQSGDELAFTDQLGITGTYNPGTGVLTLTGTASKSDYQTALRSITFSHTGDNPGSPKTVEFKANDGDADGNPATKNIAVTGVNDGPTLNTTGSALDYDEGDGPVAVDGGLSLTDPDSTQVQGATVQITGNHAQAEDELAFTDQNGITGSYNDSTGLLTLSGTATLANYQTALRSVTYENSSDTPSTSTRTVSFQADDGAAVNNLSNVATRNINVSPTNDAPVVTTSAGNTAYSEGGAAAAVDGALTVTDPDDTNLESAQVRISSNFESGDVLTFADQSGISGVYTSGTGVLTLTGTASKSDYQTALRSIEYSHTSDNPSSSKTVEFKANDGDSDSNLATKNIAVTGVNDAPTLTTTVADLDYDEGDGPVAVDSGLTVSDPDSTQIQGATVQVTGNFASAEDELAFTNQNGITGAYNDSTGTLTLSGTTSLANYQTALRSVTYENSSQTPSTSDRTVSFQATDAEGDASNVATRDITVSPTNDAPVVTTSPGDTAYEEGDPETVIDGELTVTDADDTNIESAVVRISSNFQTGDNLAFTDQSGITGSYVAGTGVLTLSGTASVSDYQAALRTVAFETTAGNPSASKTVEFKVNDGDADSTAATKGIAIGAVNDPPDITSGGTLTYTENDPATAVHSALTVTEPEGENVDGASASITTGFESGEDALAWIDNNGSDNIELDAGNSDAQTITLTGVDTAANYQAALRAVTYVNSDGDTPSTASRTVTFSASDELGAPGSDTRGITVVAVDDAPLAVDDSATVQEDAAATSVDVLTNDTDVDAGPKTISSATDPANGTVVLTGGSPGAHTGLTYEPDPNYCNDAPLASADTFDYTLNGGDSGTVSITVTCVNDAPVADDETFNGNDSAHGNTTLQVDDPDDNKSAPAHPHTEIAGDILAGDTDVDGPGPLTVTPGTFATNDGGSVTIESDGDFVFSPAASTSCTDTSDFFDYTVEDSGSPEQTDTGRVTIAIAGCVWYVNNNAAGNSGTSSQPFDTLAQAETASGSNHTVFVFDGDNTSTGYDTGFAMNSGERLIGEHEGLVVDPDGGGGLTADSLHPANAGARPSLTATSEDVVLLDDGNEVRGFNIDPNNAGGIAGGAGDTGGGTIDDVNVVDAGTAGTQPGLELNGTSGTFNVTDFTYDNTGVPSTASAVSIVNAGTVSFGAGDAGDPTKINKTGGQALNVVSSGMGTSAFDEITVGGSATGGIELTNITAGSTTTFGDGTGVDLDLTTTGTTAAFRLSSAATASVPAGGTADVDATGGPAIDSTGTSSGATGFHFDDVDSTGSASDGINLAGLGSGAFSANSSSVIAGAAGISFDLDGGSGDVTFPGTFNNGTGQTAEITGRTGGAVSFSGAVSDTIDAGGGIALSSNSGGSTTFSNASKTINTTTSAGVGNPVNNAITMLGSDGHTLTLSGGTLDIDTTIGKGLEADNSGTIAVTGSGNTIDTTTGRALNVTNTDIGDSDLTFQRIASAGASNGINLSNTGNANGQLVVAGNGGSCTSIATCTGGAVQSSTGAGISLNSVPGGVSLTRMAVTGGADDGVRATTVGNGLALDNSFVSSNGNAVGERGLDYDNVTGTSSINSTTVTGSGEENARIDNDTGTLGLTVSGSTFSSNSTLFGGDGLLLYGDGTATMRSLIQNSTFSANRDDGFNLLANADSNMDLTFNGNTVNAAGNAGAVSAHAGVTLASNTTSNVRIAYSGGTITGADGSALIINPIGSTSTFDATVENLTIGTVGVAGSGSASGQGIRAIPTQNTDAEIVLKNNSIHGTGQNGMLLRHNDGGGTSDFTVTGNLIRTVGSGNEPIFVQSASLNTDTTTVCADIGGTAAFENDFAGQAAGGVTDIAFRRPTAAAGAHLQLAGFSGNGASLADITTYIQNRNVGSPTVANFSGALEAGPSACQQPTAPQLP